MNRLPVLALALALGACTAPDTNELMTSLDLTVADTPAEATAVFAAAFADAEESLDVCIPQGEDEDLTDAILAAWDRGIDVRVATDIDEADDPGIATLIDAGVPVSLADAGISYHDFLLNETLTWTSEETVMTHAFAVIDYRGSDYLEPRVVQASSIGSLDEGPRIVFEATGEALVEDMWLEQNQIFGGADSVATTAYDAMAKSIADPRWRYGTSSDLELQVWFAPQERTTKRVIDEVYRARSDIRILTDDFSNEGLARALQDKAERGFDVQIVVGPAFGSVPGAAVVLLQETDDVDKLQVNDLGEIPTIVLIDYQETDLSSPKAMVLTHDMISASRIIRGEAVVNDQLVDGAMWQLVDWNEPSDELLALEDVYEDILATAEAL